MILAVLLTEDAARDLEDLYDYIAEHDAPGKAAHVLTRIAKAFRSLAESPNRGPHPRDLKAFLKDRPGTFSVAHSQRGKVMWFGNMLTGN